MKFTIKSSFLNAIKNKSKWRLTLRKIEEKNEREREREKKKKLNGDSFGFGPRVFIFGRKIEKVNLTILN